jgi:hypothetical protein
MSQYLKDILKEMETEQSKALANVNAKALGEFEKRIADMVDAGLNEEQIRKIAQSVIDDTLKDSILKPVTITIKAPRKPAKQVEKAHYNFEKLTRIVGSCKLNCALIGEAGTGKTFGALQLGDALGLKNWLMSFSPQDRKHEVKGFLDGSGRFHAPAIKNAYVQGGLLILDEYDRANPEVSIAMNALLSGDTYMFADNKMYTKHKDFRVVACQNTTGMGPSKRYTAARAQDGSTLNRFVRLDWDTDEALETSICGNTIATRAVQQMRKNARKLSMDSLIISPRQSIHANELVNNGGFSVAEALEHSITLGLADDVKKRLMADVKLS